MLRKWATLKYHSVHGSEETTFSDFFAIQNLNTTYYYRIEQLSKGYSLAQFFF